MPTQVDTPINTGSYTQWGLWGSAPNKMAAVATSDGDASVVYASSGGRLVIDQYVFPPLAAISDPVTSASILARTRMYLQGAGGQSYYLRWNGATVGTNRWVEVRWAGGYTNISYSAAAGELALAAVNGQHGMQFSAAGGPSNKAEVWVTYLARTVEFGYDVGSAGEFAHLIGSLVGALIGSNLLFRQMAEISAEMGRIRLLPSEYEPAWRAWNAQKRMVMV